MRAPADAVAAASDASRYRREIDGLRALAVLEVIGFHYGVPGMSSGFVGVDVFFVISGFLITRLLLERRQEPEAVRRFYARRVRRILPALVVMLMAAFAAAWLWLLPRDLVRFAISLGAAALFVVNQVFMARGGYYTPESQHEPLLHVWSLSVEEQFYLLYPWLVLALAARVQFLRRWLISLAALCWLFAWALSIRSEQAAFYFGPARAWELLLGAALACSPPMIKRAYAAHAVAALGLVLIIGSAAGLLSGRADPVVELLAPCLGAALVLASGEGGTVPVPWLLASRPAVVVGLMSYSLYLWHWPVQVFVQATRPFEEASTLLLGAVCVVLAFLSWRFVEMPVRRMPVEPRIFLRAAAASVAMLLVASAAVIASDGGGRRFPEKIVWLDGFVNVDLRQQLRVGRCFLLPGTRDVDRFDRGECLRRVAGERTVMLVGDSEAAHLWVGMQRALAGVSVTEAAMSGCRPLLITNGDTACNDFMREMLFGVAARDKPDLLVFAARWSLADIPALGQTLARLRAQGVRLVVVGPVVEYRDALPHVLALAEWHGDRALPDRARRTELFAVDAALKAAAAEAGVVYISLHDILCPSGERCTVTTADGAPLQFDESHFTSSGSEFVARRMKRTLLEALGS